jgi:SAM-dependent methyltransferase
VNEVRESLVEILACPECGAGLRLNNATRVAEEIDAGELGCSGCTASYPVRGGIPRLLPPSWRHRTAADTELRTARHFREEFLALAEADRDMMAHHLLEFYFYSRTGLDPAIYERFPGVLYPTELPDRRDRYRPDSAFLKGKQVLDAGCGPGRFVPVAAESAERVVGLDLGDHIERARARCRGLPNTEFVQGSVLRPPFRAHAFDYIYSIGVLHHTPDPAGAIRRLAALARDGASMSVWLYPWDYWGGPLKSPVGKFLHKVISSKGPDDSLRFCSRYLYPVGRLQMALARRRWTKLLFAPLFVVNIPRHPQREVMITTIHDYYGPPIISTHTFEELEKWLQEAGFAHVQRLPVPVACYASNRGAA